MCDIEGPPEPSARESKLDPAGTALQAKESLPEDHFKKDSMLAVVTAAGGVRLKINALRCNLYNSKRKINVL